MWQEISFHLFFFFFLLLVFSISDHLLLEHHFLTKFSCRNVENKDSFLCWKYVFKNCREIQKKVNEKTKYDIHKKKNKIFAVKCNGPILYFFSFCWFLYSVINSVRNCTRQAFFWRNAFKFYLVFLYTMSSFGEFFVLLEEKETKVYKWQYVLYRERGQYTYTVEWH